MENEDHGRLQGTGLILGSIYICMFYNSLKKADHVCESASC